MILFLISADPSKICNIYRQLSFVVVVVVVAFRDGLGTPSYKKAVFWTNEATIFQEAN